MEFQNRDRWNQEGQGGGGGVLEWTRGTSERVADGDGEGLSTRRARRMEVWRTRQNPFACSSAMER